MRAASIIACLSTWLCALVPLAQTQRPSGNDAWEAIRKSAPYEWEGDLEAIAEWTLGNYGKFLKEYPSHPLAAEAMLNIGKATWARGGYPELFGYIIAPTWAEHDAKTRYLEQWFDTGGFGGGLGRAAKQDTTAAVRAREIFVALAAGFPSSTSAVSARYYSAVILDYCLNDVDRALSEYLAFVKEHPTAEPHARKARSRLAALRR